MRHALILLLAVCPAGVGLHPAGIGRFDLEAKATPLAEVLACMREQAGVKVQYDGISAPRALVSISLSGMTVAQLVDRLFEGQGLNYALSVDPEGKGRALLIVSAASTAASARSSRPTPPSALDPRYELREETDSMADPVLMGEATEPPPPPAGEISSAMPNPASAFAVPVFPLVLPNFSQMLRPEPIVLTPTTRP